MLIDDITYLEAIIGGLVQHPDCVKVVRTEDSLGTLLSVTVHRDDMGVIIGRDGHTSQSIRTLMRTFGMKDGKQERITVKINEPE